MDNTSSKSVPNRTSDSASNCQPPSTSNISEWLDNESKTKPTRSQTDRLYDHFKISLNFSKFDKNQNILNNIEYTRLKKTDFTFGNYFDGLQSKLYYFLERPSGHTGLMYRCFTFLLILISILFSAFTTLVTLQSWAKHVLFWFELIVNTFFLVEYVARVWSFGYRKLFIRSFSRLSYILQPVMVIELSAIVFGFTLVLFGTHYYNGQLYFVPVALTMLRFTQLLRMLNIDRRARTWILLLDVIKKHKFELVTSIYIGFILMLLSSYLILIFEKSISDLDEEPKFHSYADAIYWSIITMTTIGYGKIVATGLCILGVAFWTLPGGIIGSGFALKVEQENKQEQFNRLLPSAASLIQSWWRMKIGHNLPTRNSSRLVSVLKTFISISSYSHSGSKPDEEKNEKKKHTNHLPTAVLLRGLDMNHDLNEDEDDKLIERELKHEREMKDREFVFLKLKPEQLVLIRTLLLLKYFVAKKKFKQANKPYDFNDVIDQYTQGNLDIIVKIKDLQRKLDQMNSTNRALAAFLKCPDSVPPTLKAAKNAGKLALSEQRSPTINESFSLDYRSSIFEQKLQVLDKKLDELRNLLTSKTE